MFFFIPFSYGLTTRSKGFLYKASFFLVFVMPIALSVYMGTSENVNWLDLLLAFCAFYVVYEIGYLFNDTITIEKETNPTRRLGKKDEENVSRLILVLVSFRVIIASICILVLLHRDSLNTNVFLVFLVILNFVYSLHNMIRSRWNALTFFLLMIFKYFTIPILFIPMSMVSIYLLMLFLVISLPRAIEHLTKRDYNFPLFLRMNFDVFRVFYYTVLSILGLILYFCDKRYLFLLIQATTFLFFRLIVLFALQKNRVKNRYRKMNYNKGVSN